MTDSWRDRPPPGRAGGDDDVEVNVLKAFHFGEQRDVGLAAADHIPQRRADGSEQRSQIRGFIGSRVIERDGMTARDKHQPAGQRRAGRGQRAIAGLGSSALVQADLPANCWHSSRTPGLPARGALLTR